MNKIHPKFEVSVKALIYDQDRKLLLAKDDQGKWDLPGGRIDENETVEQCLKREVLEELGVNVLESKLRLAELMDYDDHKKRLCLGYEVGLDSLNFKPSNENVESRYFSKDEFGELNQAYLGLKNIKNKLYD